MNPKTFSDPDPNPNEVSCRISDPDPIIHKIYIKYKKNMLKMLGLYLLGKNCLHLTF